MKLHERIRFAREAKGLTRQRVEELGGIAKGYMSRMEAGKRGTASGGSVQMMQRLARVLDVRFEWLLNGTEPMRDEGESEQDELPNRTTALSIAREGGVPETVLQAVRAERVERSAERSVLWWIEEIQLRRAMLEREGCPPESNAPSTAPPVTQIRRRFGKNEAS